MDFSVVTIEQALKELNSSFQGLSNVESTSRLRANGQNIVTQKAKYSLLHKIIEPFKSAFVIILIIAGAISVLAGKRLDAIVIVAVIIVNAIIYYFQRFSADKVVRSLRQRDIRPVHCLRNGQIEKIPSAQLVTGDVILIAEGIKVPADGRLIKSNALFANESMLTGESMPVNKHDRELTKSHPIYERANMLFSGTTITAGEGQLLITATGNATELGKLSNLSEEEDELSPLQKKINKLTSSIIGLVSVLVSLAFILALIRGIELIDGLRFLLALSVSAIPEGLPVAVALVMIIGVQRMAKRHALVRNLAAIETLGQSSIVATDKTGTITENKLEIFEFVPYKKSLVEFKKIMAAANATEHNISSDPLEKLITSSKILNKHFMTTRVAVIPFRQSMRMSGAIYQAKSNTQVFIKGATEQIIRFSKLDKSEEKIIQQQVDEFSNQGYRIISFASKSITGKHNSLSDSMYVNFDYNGFIVLGDPIRAQVNSAVNKAHRAGVDVLLLTGDHLSTARAVAQQVGIIDKPSLAAEGSIIDKLSPIQIRQQLKKTKVLARVLPEHKYSIIDAFRKHAVVSMTGDGVNDVPALVRADVGIAVGNGSDAAKEASDMILLNNNFATIIEAISLGRSIVANIRKMIMYLFATNLGEILVSIGALILNLPLPITAIQILWINLVTDGFTVIPLGLEEPEENQMLKPPDKSGKALISKAQFMRVLATALCMSALTLSIYAFYINKEPILAGTMAFYCLVVVQWTNSISIRTEHSSFINNIFRPNWWLYLGISLGVCMQAIIMFTPLQEVFGVVAISTYDYLVLLWCMLFTLIVNEIIRILSAKFN